MRWFFSYHLKYTKMKRKQEEYSEFYCNFDCAVEDLINRARCTPLDLKDKEQVKEVDAVIKRGRRK